MQMWKMWNFSKQYAVLSVLAIVALKAPCLAHAQNSNATAVISKEVLTVATVSKLSNDTKLNIIEPAVGAETATAAASLTSGYCAADLCRLYNGSHFYQVPHIACNNDGHFNKSCGKKPHLLYMSERRRNFLLGLHNLARNRIASGEMQSEGYKSASHMPMLKWDNELEQLATYHVKRCQFNHDKCRNTARFAFSGQNIGYFWIGREFRSHSKRMKSFIINWFREYRDANQSYIDRYVPHPEGKKIGHFTLLVSDRVHRMGCAAVRYRDPQYPSDMRFLMTCNYDFNNIIGEPIYQSGAATSKCSHKISEQFPALCDWKDAVYDYDSEESLENESSSTLDNNIL